jgi:hypothetical protein
VRELCFADARASGGLPPPLAPVLDADVVLLGDQPTRDGEVDVVAQQGRCGLATPRVVNDRSALLTAPGYASSAINQ